jgi:hypothetical protein
MGMAMIPIKGGYVNSNAVRFIRDLGDDGSKLEMDDGTICVNRGTPPEELTSVINATIIPAEKECFLISYAPGSEDEFWFTKEPILAWQITPGRCPEAITVIDGTDRLGDTWAVLHPDGSVAETHNQMWDSLEKWEATARRVWAETRAEYLVAQKTTANCG